jgi:spore maturation protein B
MTDLIVPALMLFVVGYGLFRRVNVYEALVRGMGEGLRICASVFPAVLVMLVGIAMLRASGAVDLLGAQLAPLAEPLGIPRACLPLALLRPFSGSGALAVGSGVIERAGPDSPTGRIAAVMLGSSETSFYTIAVYSACLHMKDTRYALPAALCGDLAAFLLSGLSVRLLMR